MTPPSSHPHQEIINGLLQLVGYLTDNPGLPTPADVEVSWLMGGEDSERVASVREVARSWDVEPAWDESGRTVWAYWRYPGLTFAAVATLQQEAVAETEEMPAVDVDQAVPEVDCEPCGGTGTYDGGCCALCLGKGRVATWMPSPQFTAANWGPGWWDKVAR